MTTDRVPPGRIAPDPSTLDSPAPPRPRPFVIELDPVAAPEADPAAAPPVPDQDSPAQGAAVMGAARLAARRGSGLTRLAGSVFAALFALVLSVAAWDFVTGLFSRNSLLGGLALALAGLAAALAVLLALREWAGYARLVRLQDLRAASIIARDTADLRAARGVVGRLRRLYATRPETAWGLSRLAEREAEVLDADALLALAEAEILSPLDALARAEVEAAARQVATVTALVPLALADVAAALFANLRMVRRVAEIYGGRASALGSWRLLRRVATALLAAGAVALTDDMIGSVAGGGVLSRLSRRFGEGVLNGALTARLGLAAMEECRPMPFVAVERPGVTATVSRALAGLFGKG